MGSLLVWIPPGGLLVLLAPLLFLVPKRLLGPATLAIPLLSAAHLLLGFEDGMLVERAVAGLDLVPVRIDRLSLVWGYVFHIAATLGAIFAFGVKDRVQQVTGLAYAGSAIAAAFCGDLLSLFVWWEMTAVTSVFLVWATRTPRAVSSGMRYFVIQVLSGVLLLAGIVFRLDAGLPIAFEHLGLTGGIDTTLIFVAFGIKAAFPLLHNWLQDAYPNATPTGTVFLSSFTTKLAIYALARAYAGTDLLIYLGAAMTLFPIFYAVIENDLRKVLAYSLNNQLGYMIVGVGIGTELAINGTASHAFAHILYKAVLFMAMGAVLMRTGTANGSELGGLYKSMPWTTALCIVGAAAISGFPLTSGFISKSMIVSAAGHEHETLVYLALLFASAGVFHHSGIKIPYFAFFAHDSGKRPAEAPLHMLIAMGIGAFLCILLGVAPSLLYGLLPYPVDYVPYTADHVVGQMQLLLGSALAFGLLNRIGAYPPELRSTVLDTDWLYRRWAAHRLAEIRPVVAFATNGVKGWLFGRADAIGAWAYRAMGPGSRWARTWDTGQAAVGVAVVLSLYALLYFQLGDTHMVETHGTGHDAGHGPADADHAAPGHGATTTAPQEGHGGSEPGPGGAHP